MNVLAAYPEHRGKGLGTALLDLARAKALKLGRPGLSIIVSDANRAHAGSTSAAAIVRPAGARC